MKLHYYVHAALGIAACLSGHSALADEARASNTTATSGRSCWTTALRATGRTAPRGRPTCGSTSATRPIEMGAIVPGDPDASEMIRRILSDDDAGADAAAGDEEDAHRRAEADCSSAGSAKGPSISRTGR